MPAYTAITDATLTAGRPITETLMRTIRDNLDHLKNATDGLTSNVTVTGGPGTPATASTSYVTVTRNRLYLEAGTYTFRGHAEIMVLDGNCTTDTAHVRLRIGGETFLEETSAACAAFDAVNGGTAGIAVATGGWTDLDVQLKTSNASKQAAHRHITVSWLKTA